MTVLKKYSKNTGGPNKIVELAESLFYEVQKSSG